MAASKTGTKPNKRLTDFFAPSSSQSRSSQPQSSYSQSTSSSRLKRDSPTTPSVTPTQTAPGPSMPRTKLTKRPTAQAARPRPAAASKLNPLDVSIISLSSGGASDREVISLSSSSSANISFAEYHGSSPIHVPVLGEQIDLTFASSSDDLSRTEASSPLDRDRTRVQSGEVHIPTSPTKTAPVAPKISSPLTTPPTSPEQVKPVRRTTRQTSRSAQPPRAPAPITTKCIPCESPLAEISPSQHTLRTRTPAGSVTKQSVSPAQTKSIKKSAPTTRSGPAPKGTRPKGRPKRKRPEEEEESLESDDGPMGDLIIALPPPNVIPRAMTPVRATPAQSMTPASARHPISPTSTVSQASSRPSKRARTSPLAEQISPLKRLSTSTPAHHASPAKSPGIVRATGEGEDEMLPSSQKGEEALELAFSSPAESQQRAPPVETQSGQWEGAADGGDWDMDATRGQGDGWGDENEEGNAHIASFQDKLKVVGESLASTRSMDEVEVSLALPVLTTSPSPTVPSSAIPTPSSPARAELTKEQLQDLHTKDLIAKIKANARKEVAEEMEEEQASLDLADDSDELEDLDDVWNAAMADKTRDKKRNSPSVDEPPTSPLSTPPSSPSPSRPRTRAGGRAESPTPPPNKRARLTPPTTSRKKESAKSNRDLNKLLKQAEKLERSGKAEAIRRAEEILNSSPKTPSPGRKRTYSQSSGGSQELDLIDGGNVRSGAVLGHLGEDKDEMVKLFERDRAERREQQLREEHGRKGSRPFWDRSTNSLELYGKTEDWAVPLWKEDETMSNVMNGVRQGDVDVFKSLLRWLPLQREEETQPLVQWLFAVATRHPQSSMAHAACDHLLNLIPKLSGGGGVLLEIIIQACSDIGVTADAASHLPSGTNSISVGWNPDRAWILTSLVCSFARAQRFEEAEMPSVFALLLLISMDSSTTPELRRDITLALEECVNREGLGAAVCLEICTRVGALAKDWTIAQKSLLLATFPHGRVPTMIMARWLAVDMIVPDSLENLDGDRYQKPPSLPTLLAVINYQSRTSLFGIHAETDYEELHLVTQIMETALTLVHTYLDESDSRGQLTDIAEELSTVYTKIMDTRAAHLERTEAKDGLQRLSLRLRYSIPKSAPSVQAKLPFAFKTAATPHVNASTKTTLPNAVQPGPRPRPRRLVA